MLCSRPDMDHAGRIFPSFGTTHHTQPEFSGGEYTGILKALIHSQPNLIGTNTDDQEEKSGVRVGT